MSVINRIFRSKRDHMAERAARLTEVESLMGKLQDRLNEVAPGVEVRRDSTHFHANINGCGVAVPFDEAKYNFDASIEFIVCGLKMLQGARGE